jgi:hypothetical protein
MSVPLVKCKSDEIRAFRPNRDLKAANVHPAKLVDTGEAGNATG